MKTFILYNSISPESTDNATLCLNSFNTYSSWEPILFDGYTQKDLPYLELKYPMKTDRARYQPHDYHYKNKKACFYSHFQLWLNCIKIEESIAIVEHDTYCNGDLPSMFDFDGIVNLSTESIFRSFDRYANARTIYENLGHGLHNITLFPPLPGWGYCMPGNTAYCITPKSANTLVEDCFKNGWQQNDVLMSNKLCKIEILSPSPIVYDPSRELRSSTIGIQRNND